MRKLSLDRRQERDRSHSGLWEPHRLKRAGASAGEWLARYAPRTLDRDRWESLRSFVVPMVLALAPAGPPIAARYARGLTRLADWCLVEGLPLDLEIVLDPDTIERFISSLPKNRSTSTYRADLRRIGRRLTKQAPWEPLPEPLSRRAVAAPYSPKELADLRRFAGNQSTRERKRRAIALIALGAGAGLDGRWCTKIQPEDLLRTPAGMLVRVGAPNPRVVPILRGFQADLEELPLTPDDEVVVGGAYRERKRASDLVTRLDPAPGFPRLSLSRLRSTWLVHHLTIGTRLPELAAAAGLVGVTVLSDLLEFVPPLPKDEADRQLRGRTGRC
jgi:hypothetical protein